MKLLDGRELADFIKERQAKQVRSLRQSKNVVPHLAIVRTNPDPVVDSYMRLKRNYGSDILIDVTVHTVEQSEAKKTIERLNNDESVHGIIVQIPLPDPSQTTEILNSVDPSKDVDGLAEKSDYDAPTPMAISWLLAGYNIELRGKRLLIVGHGRLVGQPLARLWKNSGLEPVIVDKSGDKLADETLRADVLVTATGVPGLISTAMVQAKAVIVDAGVSTDSNGLIGDVRPEVREMPYITITPDKGGVGPLTVCALFDNVIRAAQKSADKVLP